MREGKDKLYAQNWIEQFKRKWYICNERTPLYWFEEEYRINAHLMGRIQDWDRGEGRAVWNARDAWFDSDSNGITS